MRLDHLLSKRESKGCFTIWLSRTECTDAGLAQMKVYFCDETNKQMYMRDCLHEYEAKRSMKREDRHEGHTKTFGGDALRGNTRSYPEHDG